MASSERGVRVELVASASPQGKRWRVRVLPEGTSKNEWQGFPIHYSAELLERVCDKLKGVPAYIYQAGPQTFDHLPENLRAKAGDLLANLVGWFENPEVVTEGTRKALQADLYLHDGAHAVRDLMRDIWQRGKQLGFSIVADGVATIRKLGDKMVAYMEDLDFRSVDPVTWPATNTAVLALVESGGDGRMGTIRRLLEPLATALVPGLAGELAESGDTPGGAIALCSRLADALSASDPAEAVVRNVLLRARGHLADGKVQQATGLLSSLLAGEAAAPEENPDVEETLDAKLGDLAKLIESEEWSQAIELLRAILSDEYPAPGGERLGGEGGRLAKLLGLLKAKEKDDATSLLKEIRAKEAQSPYPAPEEVQWITQADRGRYVTGTDIAVLLDAGYWVTIGRGGFIDLIYDPRTGKYLTREEAFMGKMQPPEARGPELPPPVGGGGGTVGQLGDLPLMMSQSPTELDSRVGSLETARLLDEVLESCTDLPRPALERVRRAFTGTPSTREEILGAVRREREYIASLNQSVRVSESEGGLALEVKKLQSELNRQRLEGKFRDQASHAGLPSPAEERLYRQLFAESEEPTEEEIVSRIKAEAEYVDGLIGNMASTVRGMGVAAPVTVEESEKAVRAYFDRAFGLEEVKSATPS